MRIVFMGTPDFAAAILQRLIDTGRNVVGVFSQPDKPVGRKQIITPTATKVVAMEHNIPVFQPAKLRDGEALKIMQELKPDLTVVAAYGKILPKDILDVAPLGNVNVHGSLLPEYRGSAPIQWSVINGDKVTGITTMFMAEGMDTGDMIMKFELPIGEDETAGELFDKMAELGAESIEKTLELFDNGEVKAEPQNEEEATYAPMLKKEMGEIDFGKTAEEIHNLVRGLNPWPMAYT
ncbi:MAG: methionyl-tRNA formyltransferase, partial [Oscillospiraceae bacterium]|nr:methionyl-tRNA formyltransferase [Oscillospiraceae bacterium]